MHDPLEEREQCEHHEWDERIRDLPVTDDDASCQSCSQGGANHPRRRVFPELATCITQRERFACRAIRRDSHDCSSRLVITASIAVVAGSRRSMAACFGGIRVAGRDRSCECPIRLRAADLGGHHGGQSRQRGLIGGAKRVVHEPEDDGIGPVDDVVPERQRMALPLDRVAFGVQDAHRLVEAVRSIQAGGAPRPTPQPSARCATESRGCCGPPTGRVRLRAAAAGGGGRGRRAGGSRAPWSRRPGAPRPGLPPKRA